MSLILPHAPQFSRYVSNIAIVPATYPGTLVNHYATTAHTKNPTPTELISATAFDACFVIVSVVANAVSYDDSSTLTDIMIGAATEESILIPDLMSGWVVASAYNARHYMFPLYVPSGSRLSARSQSVRTSGGVYVFIGLFGGPRDPAVWWYGQQVTCYGANASNSAGTKFTPGSEGGEGTAVTVGTTSADHECLVLGVQGHPDDVDWSAQNYHFDVGIGASSTEWILQDGYIAATNSNCNLGCTAPWWPAFCPVPSGTELMVRGEGSGTADALSAAIYGVS